MIKEVVIGLFHTASSSVMADRYYLRHHGPDVVRISGPWLRRYESYKTYPPPQEAIEHFGARGGRYAELWFDNADEYRGRPKLIIASLTPKEITQGRDQTVIVVPALPTEEFLVKHIDPEKTPILRWVCGIRYPAGVSPEEGENWYLEVHSQEVIRQPTLLGFYSYRALRESFPSPVPPDSRPVVEERPWIRVSELWYKNFADWRRAVIESPPKYTPPPWDGAYPFVDMASNFIDLKPDVDFLRGNYTIP